MSIALAVLILLLPAVAYGQVNVVVVSGDPALGAYAVEAQTTLPGLLVVNFLVDGAQFHTESIAKYCLFGGDGPCAAGHIGAGTHVITAEVRDPATLALLGRGQLTVTEGTTLMSFSYKEPSTDTTGKPLTNLALIRLYMRVNGGPEQVTTYPASGLTGGATVRQTVVVPALRGTVVREETAVATTGAESARSNTGMWVISAAAPPSKGSISVITITK